MKTWAQQPQGTRSRVIQSLRDDARLLRHDWPDDRALLEHADALASLADYLERIEPSIRKQHERGAP